MFSEVLVEPGISLSPKIIVGHLCPSSLDEPKDKRGFWTVFRLLWITPPVLSRLIFHAVFVKPPSLPTLRTRRVRSRLSFFPSSHPRSPFGHELPQPAGTSMQVLRRGIDMSFTSPSTQDKTTSSSFRRTNATLWRATEFRIASSLPKGNGPDNPEGGESRKPSGWRSPAMQRRRADGNLTDPDLFLFEENAGLPCLNGWSVPSERGLR